MHISTYAIYTALHGRKLSIKQKAYYLWFKLSLFWGDYLSLQIYYRPVIVVSLMDSKKEHQFIYTVVKYAVSEIKTQLATTNFNMLQLRVSTF